MSDFRIIHCVSCGGNTERLLKEVQFEENRFRVVQCRKCGLVFTNPQPSPEWIKSSHDNAKGVGFYSHKGARSYHWHYINGLKIIAKFHSSGKLLDVGCGVGYFLNMAKRRGYDVLGIDFSSVAVAAAKEKYNLNIMKGEIRDYGFKPGIFNVITLWNVLEHLYEPEKDLSIIFKYLSSEGILFIETPNIILRAAMLKYGISKMLLKGLKRDSNLIAWEHLFYWNPYNLRNMLFRVGFSAIWFYPINAPTEGIIYNIAQWFKKILYYISSGKINICFPIVVVARK